MKRFLPGVLALALSGLAPLGCGRPPSADSGTALPTAKVRVQEVERKTRIATEDVVGTVQAKLRAVIEAKISGRMEKMLVAPGQPVKAGDLLVQIDAREIQARLDQALAVRDQTGPELERIRKLLVSGAASQQDFDSAQARHRVAVANAVEAETMLGYARVTAPFNGIITRKYTDVGDLAAPGKRLLEEEDPDMLRLEADVPEAVISHLQLGDALRVRVAGLTNELSATVSEIAPTADPGSRTFLVKFDLPPTRGLRAGQFGRVTVPIGETAALRVPASAVIQRGQMEAVYVIENQHAQLRLVKTGKRIGGEVEVVSGLSAGEPMVTDGAAGLRDGQRVEVTR